jgi:DNA polymerase-3 subunit delta
MAKQDSKAESIYNLSGYISDKRLAPIYFFFGEDLYTISNAVKVIAKLAEKMVGSEFDKQVIEATKETNIAQIVDEASAFPFGGEKKLVIVKNFENINEKKTFAEYVNNPADFTILIISQSGKKLDLSKEPYVSLNKRKYIFQAMELRGAELVQWVMRETKKLNMKMSQDNAWAMVDMIGENKALLEMNLLKFANYIKPGEEITPGTIEKLTSITKEFTVFNLQDAVGAGNKARALKIAYNLIGNGKDPIFIVTMLAKFVNTVARSIELSARKISKYQAAQEADVSSYYYENCLKARFLMSHQRLAKAGEALLWADTTIKSTSLDSKSLTTILISRMMG